MANDSGAVHLAARSGQGIAFLSFVEVFDDLRAGQLVRVLSDFPSPDLPVWLAYPSRRHLAPRTRLVMDFLLEQFREAAALLAPVSDRVHR
jgi:DNA-binding transcriptional LysR family regulator